MATALEAAGVASDMLMWAFSIAAIALVVLVAFGKLKVPTERPPRRWQVAIGILATLLLASAILP